MVTRKGAWVPDRGDIVWIGFNSQVGREMKDLHPMLVLSPRVLNDRTSLVTGLPMTTASYNDSNPFAIPFTGANGVVSDVLAHRPKSFNWRARTAKSHACKQVPLAVLQQACESLNQIVTLPG